VEETARPFLEAHVRGQRLLAYKEEEKCWKWILRIEGSGIQSEEFGKRNVW
jgi:hypothetical protein